MSRIRLTALLLLSACTAFAQHAGSTAYSSLLETNQPWGSPAAASASASAAGVQGPAASAEYVRPFSRLALGAKVGILGVGAQVATPLTARMNLSGGANFFSYTDKLTSDGIHYDANLRLRSAEASLDWFPFGNAFRLSPGALLYNGNQVTGNAGVPGDTTFTLNDVNYLSSSSDPVSGMGSVKFNKAAPKLTFGFGNMLPRSGRHFSVPMELGFAYIGEPKVVLNLKGTACDPTGVNCRDVATTPQIQANLVGQQNKLQNDISPARFFPIVSVGFAANF